MRAIHNYKILEDLKLIIQHSKGNIKVDDYIKLKNQIVKDKSFDPNFDKIIDLREANLDSLSNNDLNKIAKWVNSNIVQQGSMMRAIITNNPNQVVKSMLFHMHEQIPEDTYKTFSSIQGAIEWLSLDGTSNELIYSTLSEFESSI